MVKSYTFSLIGIAVLFIGMSLSACQDISSGQPDISLQRALSKRLREPTGCPTGDSRDIQQIVNATDTRELIRLPEGCYQINSTINIPPCTQLVGAGADKTILYRQPGKLYSGPILQLRGAGNASCTTHISGLAFLGVRDTQDTGQDYGISITNLKGFRIDHTYFEGFGFAAVRVEGASSGVIDHAIFMDNFKKGIDNLGYGVVVYGTGQWLSEVNPGSSEATYVEDSLFRGNRHAIAASNAAYYVFRNNQVLGSVEACAIDAHGMGYGSQHGTRYVEIYNNTIVDPVYNECGIGIRGGSGVIYENTIQGYKNPLLLILEWGTPDIYKASYPALDQVQRLYIWDNDIQGGPIEPQVDATGVGFIEAGRDYFTTPLAGYVAYAYPHPLASDGPFDQALWPPDSHP